MICFLKFIFVKRSNNFFSNKIINSLCPRHSIFNFFNHKNYFRPIWSVTFCKNILIYFDILALLPILNFGFLSVISSLESIYVFDFTSTVVILIFLWYVLLYLYRLIYQYKHFLKLKPYIYKFYFLRPCGTDTYFRNIILSNISEILFMCITDYFKLFSCICVIRTLNLKFLRENKVKKKCV